MSFSNNENKIIIIETTSFYPDKYAKKKVKIFKRYIMISNEFIKKIKYLSQKPLKFVLDYCNL